MKKIIQIGALLFMSFALFVSPAAAAGFNIDEYDAIAKKTVAAVISGNVNADQMIADMVTLMAMGVAGCKFYLTAEGTPANEAKAMEVTIANADKMTSLDLESIEPMWHDGGVLTENGVDVDAIPHFSPGWSYFDAVVHPATAIICLRDYQASGNDELLDQVQDELTEVREHLKHLH